MPIDPKVAKKLLRPLCSMPMTPTDTDAINLRSDALSRYSRSDSHAARVVQMILEREQYFPTVALMVLACETTPDDAQAASARKGCPWCHGDGWRTVDGPYGLSAAYPCDHTDHGKPEMQVPMTAALNSRYMREHQEAIKRAEAWRASPEFPPTRFRKGQRQSAAAEPMRRVTAADFEALIP